MTIESEVIVAGPFLGNNTTAQYDTTFKVVNDNDLVVFETDAAGSQTTLVIDVDYTVAALPGDSGYVRVTRLAGNLPTGFTWYFRLDLALLQETDFENQGAFFPRIHAAAFDRIVQMIQQNADKIERAFRLADSDPDGGVVNLTLPPVADRLNRIVTFNENGDIDLAAVIGTSRGEWSTGTQYNARDIYLDPATNNVYFVELDHVSTTVAADLAAGKVSLLVDAEFVKQQADAAAASATNSDNSAAASQTSRLASETARDASQAAQGLSETARDASQAARDISVAAASDASDSADEAGAFLYDFKGRWFGGLASDPLVDLNGDALNAGDAYFNTTVNQTRVYDGATWGAAFDVVKADTPTAQAGTDDAAYMTPLKVNMVRKFIGEVFYIDTSKAGVELPNNDGLARYIQLTAGLDGVGEFNEGLLTNESITGTAPLVVATAEIADPESPMFGETIELLNTENRYEMPSTTAGVKANDVMQQITGYGTTSRLGRFSTITNQGAISFTEAGGTQAAAVEGTGNPHADINFDSANSPNARTSNHTNVKHKAVTGLMRIR